MYRCGVTIKGKSPFAKNFNTKDECENWILELMEKYEVKKSIIVNKENVKERFVENF